MFQKTTFVDQIVVSQVASEESFSNGGDSGSLVYDSDGACIGLLFGGSQGTEDQPGTTILNPIHFVTQALDIELLTPGDHPTGAALAAKKKKAARKAPRKAAKKRVAKKKAPKKKAPKKRAATRKAKRRQ